MPTSSSSVVQTVVLGARLVSGALLIWATSILPVASAQTVAYQSLPRDVLLDLPDAAVCFWIAAGDHRIRVDGLAGSWHLVQEAAS